MLIGGASKYVLISLAFWRIFSTLSHLFSCFNNFKQSICLFSPIPSPINSHLLTLHYTHYSPNFLKTALSFTLSPLLFYLAKHRPFSSSPPILFTLSNLTLIPLPTSTLNVNLKPPTCFNLSSITLFDKHLHLYLPSLCSTTFNNTLHPLVTLHAVSQNKTARFVIQIMTEVISFFNSNKKMPLYIRHSCCIKIPQFQPKSTPFMHLLHHYSTHFPITQNLSNPYFISIFTFPINLFQLFIPVTPFFHILLHKKKATPRSVTSSFPFISKREAMIISLSCFLLSNS